MIKFQTPLKIKILKSLLIQPIRSLIEQRSASPTWSQIYRGNIWQTITNNYHQSLCTTIDHWYPETTDRLQYFDQVTKSSPSARITFPRLSISRTHHGFRICREGSTGTDRLAVSYCPQLPSNWHADRSHTATRRKAREIGSPWNTVGG